MNAAAAGSADAAAERTSYAHVGVVVIGRNEGAFLREGLASIPPGVARVVCVDSASVDDSVAVARAAGADVVELRDTPDAPVSAARARHAGFQRLRATSPGVELVQFLDGDCTLEPGWLLAATRALRDDEELGAVWGWRRERRPHVSVYHRLCDVEWRIPPAGETRNFGGDVLLRVEAYESAGGYDAGVVASEDHDLGVRVRGRGWRIRRLDAGMTVHDSRLVTFGQWWRRCVRRGVGYGQMWQRHRAPHERVAIRRAMTWGLAVPLGALALAWPTGGWSLAALAAYPLRAGRIAVGRVRRDGAGWGDALAWGAHCVGASFPYLAGLALHAARARVGCRPTIVEYRGGA